MKRRIVTAFKPHQKGLEKLFGSLEADILTVVWAQQHASAREVFERLRDDGQRLSYGAVKTVMDRLVNKQVLERSMVGNQYVYVARLSRAEFDRSAVEEILGSLVASFGQPVLTQFLEQLQTTEPDELDRLSQLIDDAEVRKKQG
jgi:predicted transcriptional regulator